MSSPCAIRRTLAEQFALAARRYAETAVSLAVMETSGPDYVRLRDSTVEAQRRAESAFTLFIQHIASHECGEAALNGHTRLDAEEKNLRRRASTV